MFNWLGGDKKGFVTKDDVRKLSRDEMRAFVLSFEGTDVSNTEEAEYGIIDPGHIRYIEPWSGRGGGGGGRGNPIYVYGKV